MSLARHLLLVLVVALGGCASTPWVMLTPEKVAEFKRSDPPKDDLRFAPGWRIGPIYLGMTRAEVLAALGEPQKSSSAGEATEHYFWEPERWFVRMYRGSVVSVQAYPRGYPVSGPVTFGMTALAIRVKLGDPDCVNRDMPGSDALVYRSAGVLLQVDVNGGLRAIYVVAPGELTCS